MKDLSKLLTARSGMGAVTVVAVSLFPACNYVAPCERAGRPCGVDGSVEAAAQDTVPHDTNPCPAADDAATDADTCGVGDGSTAGS
jgi:hypothetical protein